MNYYEELGLAKSASLEEIRQAYKNLSRLLHPDQYQEPLLRSLAELQMKRLNLIAETLGDPDKRRRYNLELECAHRTTTVVVSPRPAVRSLSPYLEVLGRNRGWLLLAAIGLGSALWLYYTQTTSGNPAGRLIPAAPTERPERDDATPERETRAEPPQADQAQIVSDLRRRLDLARAERDQALEELSAYRQGEAAAGAKRSSQPPPKPPDPEIASPLSIRDPANSEPPPKVATSVAEGGQTLPAPSGLAGKWFYTPTNKGSDSPGLYPPEYIELVLTEKEGVISGRYRGRYRIPDQLLPPEVNFHFRGSASGNMASFPWTGAASSKGEVRLKLLSANSMEVNWWITGLGTWRGLASGTAVLTRRQETPRRASDQQ